MQTAQTQSCPSKGSKGSCPSEAIDLDMDVDVPSLSLRTLTILGTLGDEWVDDLPPESEPKQGIKPHPTTTITPTPSSTSTELKLELEPQPDQASRKKQPRTSGKKIIKNGGKKVLFQYPAGKMTAHHFITVSWPVHLVIQQGQGNGTRTLMEFDLKPREYRTGSYGWTGNAMGNLPTDNGLVPVRAGINMIVRGSKPAKK